MNPSCIALFNRLTSVSFSLYDTCTQPLAIGAISTCKSAVMCCSDMSAEGKGGWSSSLKRKRYYTDLALSLLISQRRVHSPRNRIEAPVQVLIYERRSSSFRLRLYSYPLPTCLSPPYRLHAPAAVMGETGNGEGLKYGCLVRKEVRFPFAHVSIPGIIESFYQATCTRRFSSSTFFLVSHLHLFLDFGDTSMNSLLSHYLLSLWKLFLSRLYPFANLISSMSRIALFEVKSSQCVNLPLPCSLKQLPARVG